MGDAMPGVLANPASSKIQKSEHETVAHLICYVHGAEIEPDYTGSSSDGRPARLPDGLIFAGDMERPDGPPLPQDKAMENLLLLLPRRPQSVFVRYGLTTLIVLVCFAVQLGVELQSGLFTFFLLLPGIFLAAVLFDRGSGFYATVLSTALCIAVLPTSDGLLLPAPYLLPFVLFVLVGLALATLSEAMRKALEKAVAAERSAEVMLNELNHRIRNNLAMVASVLELQKRSQTEQGAKDAFASAVGRVHVIANAHVHLLPKEGQSLIDMREYLTVCCQNLGDALRDVRPIAVNVSAEQVLLRADRAVAMGLIVNELVTNAFKYAFPDERGGTVNVILQRVSDGKVELAVEDNGKGCPEGAKEGLGSRIVRLLAQQLESAITRAPANPGCRVSLIMPER
jgi:two-component sensor histidine kinase